MRFHFLLAAALGAAGAAAVAACGSSGTTTTETAGDAGISHPRDASTSYPDSPLFSVGDGDNGTDAPGSVLSSVHIVPADATITVKAGAQATQAYKVMGILDGASSEVDVTSRFVFYVPDNYLVGGFPLDGSPTFTTRLPTLATDPPQQGGKLTVQAEAQNPGGTLVTTTTSLTVQLLATLPDPNGGTIPQNPGGLFGGSADSSRDPVIFYPNDGTMLPPNLKLLDIHWQPGSSKNTLYQVTFSSAAANIVYYVRCDTVPGSSLVTGSCGMQLDATGYGYLSQSNAGQGPVTLTIKGTDDTGTGVGTSKSETLQFAEQPVNGGVYYWDVTDTRIMRFDFGGTETTPDVFIAPGDYGTDGTCIGCHILSPDGTKIAMSENGQNNGWFDYQADIAKVSNPPAPARTDPNWLTVKVDKSAADVIQFASFDPAGDRFVSVFGDNGPPSSQNLTFHDGTTGLPIAGATVALAFEPDHPCWSPDGTMLAMTHVGVHNTSQREYQGGIDVATFGAAATDGGLGTLGTPAVVVPSMQAGKNDYNPSFVPDSSFLLYSETTCPAGSEINVNCDSDVEENLDATTWAVQPKAGATPIHLANAAAPGLADNGLVPTDTFPRSTPFKTTQGSGTLFWFTVASQRAPGLRSKTGSTQQLLWMFAVDPAKVLSGADGSYTGFFLPFQSYSTSNHIAEWTQKIVGGTTAPPAPPPPPPPPPSPPPPVR